MNSRQKAQEAPREKGLFGFAPFCGYSFSLSLAFIRVHSRPLAVKNYEH
ncbi:hypothetical protein [Ereboglobus luteus]|nr:hypothetical protein [Ereboglobus luteus]